MRARLLGGVGLIAGGEHHVGPPSHVAEHRLHIVHPGQYDPSEVRVAEHQQLIPVLDPAPPPRLRWNHYLAALAYSNGPVEQVLQRRARIRSALFVNHCSCPRLQ